MDYYLEDLNRLEGQPKRAVADYVESNGILVPCRFDSFEEAKNSDKKIILRSEHPLEYAEISGLLDSCYLESVGNVNNIEEIKRVISNRLDKDGMSVFRGHYLMQGYCSMIGLDFDETWDKLSFSFWEYLPGINKTIVADSSIKGRYHIQENMFGSVKEDLWIHKHFIIEEGKLIKSFGCVHPDVKERGDFLEMIELYETIRNLPRFDGNNCPMMEFQSVGDKHYFLQYRRGRDFVASDFELDSSVQDNTLFVRGHTPKEGIYGKVTVAYVENWSDVNSWSWKVSDKEFGSFDFHYNWAFSNIMCPRRKLQLIHPSAKSDLNFELMKFVVKHSLNTKLFSPEVSVICKDEVFRDLKGYDNEGDSYKDFLEGSEVARLGELARKTGENQGIEVHLVSDGKRAILEGTD